MNLINSNYRLTAKKTHLSRREKQIVQLVAGGYTNSEIAELLYLSERTVENYRMGALHKLGVKNTAGLVRYALQEGLVE